MGSRLMLWLAGVATLALLVVGFWDEVGARALDALPRRDWGHMPYHIGTLTPVTASGRTTWCLVPENGGAGIAMTFTEEHDWSVSAEENPRLCVWGVWLDAPAGSGAADAQFAAVHVARLPDWPGRFHRALRETYSPATLLLLGILLAGPGLLAFVAALLLLERDERAGRAPSRTARGALLVGTVCLLAAAGVLLVSPSTLRPDEDAPPCTRNHVGAVVLVALGACLVSARRLAAPPAGGARSGAVASGSNPPVA
ncbi:MAG: hypothetical protein HZA54_20325 [Planctomycetes bacterium]|nr:hypothetical protein [Planctomycetota bacterium]